MYFDVIVKIVEADVVLDLIYAQSYIWPAFFLWFFFLESVSEFVVRCVYWSMFSWN